MIKFRAWVKPGVLSNYLDGVIAEAKPDYIERVCLVKRDDLIGNECFDEIFDFDDVILMQSTGLKDKNGVEIFEGDVVKMDRPPVNEKSLFLVKDYVLGKVIFAEVNEFGKDSWSFNGGYTGYSLEVIGNIYENSELLNIH